MALVALATAKTEHDAVRMLLQSESTMEDFMTLFVSQPEVTQKILMGSLSAMINAHTLVTIRKELNRRAAGN